MCVINALQRTTLSPQRHPPRPIPQDEVMGICVRLRQRISTATSIMLLEKQTPAGLLSCVPRGWRKQERVGDLESRGFWRCLACSVYYTQLAHTAHS